MGDERTFWPREQGPPPEHGWVCFHCGLCLKTVYEARRHFGPSILEGEEVPPECMQLVKKLIAMGFSKGHSPNMQVNLRDLERDLDG